MDPSDSCALTAVPTSWETALNFRQLWLKRMMERSLQKENCVWEAFKMNPPHVSHIGGVWERMIRSVRNVLSALLNAHGDRLDDEQLRTLMVEAEAVVNGRPIIYPYTTVPDSGEPLSPSQVLTLNSRFVLPPPRRKTCTAVNVGVLFNSWPINCGTGGVQSIYWLCKKDPSSIPTLRQATLSW